MTPEQPPLNCDPDSQAALPATPSTAMSTEPPAAPSAELSAAQSAALPAAPSAAMSTEPPAAPAAEPSAAQSAAPPVAPPAYTPPAPERDPFWGYGDVLLFLGMIVPSMMLGALIVKAVLAMVHWHPAVRVAELLPAQFVGYGVLFGSLLVNFRVRYDRPFWRSLAWTRSRIPVLLIVTSGFTTAFLVAIASGLIHTPDTSNPMTELMEGRAALLLVTFFGVTLGPLFEELGFRGFLQPLLVRGLGAAPGILLAAIPFGLLHFEEYGHSWRHVLVISLAGAAFGWMRHASGSTRAAVIMHAAYNGLFFMLMFVQRKDLLHG